jgi:hypothetical protein
VPIPLVPILKNTGLAFEQEELAGSKPLTANGHNSAGGAIGIELLFNLDQQLVFEAAAQTTTRNRLNGSAPAGDEYPWLCAGKNTSAAVGLSKPTQSKVERKKATNLPAHA